MLSILIPAYRNKETLLRLLDSIANQNINFDIEIIISDDSYPQKLDISYELEKYKLNSFTRYIYQERNLGVLGNGIYLANEAKYPFVVFSQHDDYYVDNNFFQRSIDCLIANEKLGFIFANAIFENSNLLLMNGKKGKEVVTGTEFSKMFWNKLMTSWSSVIFDNNKLKRIGGFGSGYTLTNEIAESLSAYAQEEGMGFLYKLSADFDCIIDWNPVSVRGLPPTRFSISEDHPGIGLKNDSLFFIYWNIYKNLPSITKRHIDIRKNILKQAIKFGLNAKNVSVRNYMGDSEIARKVMRYALIQNKINKFKYKLIKIKEYLKHPLRIIYKRIFLKK